MTQEIEMLHRLTKDEKLAAATLGRDEARYLVDYYYQIQKIRLSSTNQIRSMKEEPHSVLEWLDSNSSVLEGNIKFMLEKFAMAHEIGRWSLSICGIGPVIAAGLLAHIDIEKAPTVGHIWRFAGLDPTLTWLGKESAKEFVEKNFSFQTKTCQESNIIQAASLLKRNSESLLKQADTGKVLTKYTKDSFIKALSKRPWNANLKVLTWKIGESFTKVSSKESDIYGKVWLERKTMEWETNKAGLYAQQATLELSKRNFSKDTEAKLWLTGCMSKDAVAEYEKTEEKKIGLVKKLAGEPGSGFKMLCPGHIHARAKRYAVKLFLSHWHHVAYESHYHQKPPKPYILDRPGHVHFIAPPNWPMVD